MRGGNTPIYLTAFGNILESSGDTYNPIRYAGYQYDEETGLYYLNARMYDPKIARFLQEDTYSGNVGDPLSLNLYTYCHNDPLTYDDPCRVCSIDVKDLEKGVWKA
ncbi:MAG: RHS repeat-associated core domain-containing protein [Clostridia bacterium]|nr:RHS repeat-associated core domain-containing protein [Clostridia bacterium]